jgi:uncharacterized membrane protein YphA (DoxX/SURF4 family)
MTITIQSKVLTPTRHSPRILLGLLFLLPGTLKLVAPFETLLSSYGSGEPFMRALHSTGYLFTLLALTQISAGLLLLVNRFVPLALALLAPIIVNIVLFHVFVVPTPRGFMMSALIALLELFMVYRYRKVFAPFFVGKNL